MKTLYDDIRAPKKRDTRPLPQGIKAFLAPAIWVVIPGLLLGAFHLFKSNQNAMNWLVNHVTTPYKLTLSRLLDPLPISAAEILWGLAILAVLAFLVRSVWLIVRRGQKLVRLGRRVLALVAAGLLVYCGYTLLWGINYYADDFSDRSGIETRGVSTQELYTLCDAFAQQLNSCSDQVQRDENGVFTTDLDALFSETEGLYDGITAEFSFLAGPDRTPKMLLSSPLMSRLDFTGFFFPFTGETLLNNDSPACLIPATILHEMAHQRNIAGEDEANFVAVIAGLRSENPTYVYSSALLGYIHLCNALYSAAPASYRQISGTLNEQVQADLADNNAYWAQFDSPLDEAAEAVSTTVYEGFLHSYGESDGKRTYGKCVDLLAAYYFDYRWAE